MTAMPARTRTKPAQRSVFAGADVCQLAGLTLRPGSVRPQFEDALWDLTGLADAPESMLEHEKRWNFAAIRNPRWQIVAREQILALLVPGHEAVAVLPGASRTPRSPRFAKAILVQLTRWFNWLDTNAIHRLSAVSQDHCDAYLALCSRRQRDSARILDPHSLKRTISPLVRLAEYADLFSSDRFVEGFIPWKGRPSFEIAGGTASRENRTRALPDAQFRPLIAAALHLITVTGPVLAELLHPPTDGPPRGVQDLRAQLPLPSAERRDLKRLVHLHFFASLLVTAAITGMRSSELSQIMIGSRQAPVQTPGGGWRYRLASRVIKSRRFGGEPDEWVVLPIVDQAIALAETLAPFRTWQDTTARPRIFPRNWPTEIYRRFRDWVNGPAGLALGFEPIPAGPCNPRMLRRKLAQEIARRPGGLLAAKVALKHLSVVTTEGYTARPGGSQAAFLTEVQQEEQEHHLRLTTQLFRDYQNGIQPSGPGARDLIATFSHVDQVLHEHQPGQATVISNERRIENLLRTTSGTLHVGAANFCWFRDPNQALCLRLAGTPKAAKPLAGMCDSARCPQATHHPCHKPVWRDRASTFQVFLGNPRMPDGEKQRLRPEYERALAILDSIPNQGEPA